MTAGHNKTFTLVGMQHRPGSWPIINACKTGEPATLVREPSNQYDRNAIQVWIRGAHVGFLAAKENAALAAWMDRQGPAPKSVLDIDVDCYVLRAKLVAGKWPRIEVFEGQGAYAKEPERAPPSHEQQGTGYDSGAAAHERQGRAGRPEDDIG